MLNVNYIGDRSRHQIIEGAPMQDESEAREWGQFHADDWGVAVEIIDADTSEQIAIAEPSKATV